MIQDIITVLWALVIFDTIKLLSAGLVRTYRLYESEKAKRG